VKANSDLQHWLQRLIKHPNAHSDKKEPLAKDIIDERYGISAEQRLAIYQKGYRLRLLECMRAEYPLLIKAFSQSWFDAMAQRYLDHYPSSSTNLNDLGEQFPHFLEHDRPDSVGEQDDVFDFLISIAKLERFRTEVSRGQGSEGIEVDGFELITGGNVDSMKVVLAPNVRLLKTSFQLLAYLDRLDTKQTTELEKQQQYIVICRQNYHVSYVEVTAWQLTLLKLLQTNSDLDAALRLLNEL